MKLVIEPDIFINAFVFGEKSHRRLIDLMDKLIEKACEVSPPQLLAERPPSVFLSYTRDDERRVNAIKRHLSALGIKTWIDSESIPPGTGWRENIKEAIWSVDIFLACISEASTSKPGGHIDEYVEAVTCRQTIKKKRDYIIPVRIEEVDLPDVFQSKQWVTVLEGEGWDDLVVAINEKTSDQNTGGENLALPFYIYEDRRDDAETKVWQRYRTAFAEALLKHKKTCSTPSKLKIKKPFNDWIGSLRTSKVFGPLKRNGGLSPTDRAEIQKCKCHSQDEIFVEVAEMARAYLGTNTWDGGGCSETTLGRTCPAGKYVSDTMKIPIRTVYDLIAAFEQRLNS